MTLARGKLEIDPARRQLRRHDGREISTQPLVFDLLLYFVRHPHSLVTKEALIRDVWKGVVVGDGAISQAVSLLRRTLRAEAGLSQAIHTVWGKGYRLVADVCENGNGNGRGAITGNGNGRGAIAGNGARVLAAAAFASEAGDGGGGLAGAFRGRVLVGRARERAVLDAALVGVVAGRGGVVALSGEPGIGKTQLVEELAAQARAAGARVLWGACWESGGVPAFWPWAQVLRAYASDADPDERREALEPAASDLARIVPELGTDAAAVPSAAPPESVASRFALFDGVAAFLARAAARRPIVLILEDVHAADPASLRLLGLVARGVQTFPLLVVVTHREAELRHRREVARLLAEVARDGTRLPLRGLTDAEVEHLLSASFGVDATPKVVRALQAATAGNPFLLEEVMRALPGADALATLESRRAGLAPPARAAELIRRHLDVLASDVRDTLRTAAVLGAEFSLRELGAVHDSPDDVLLEQLREAADDGIVVADSPVDTRWRFRHALYREVLESELSAAARIALHRAIGETIERMHRAHLEPCLDRLAHHFLRGASRDDWRRAVEYAEAAAARALKRLAYEDADAYLEAALDVLEAANADDAERRCELWLALGICRRKAAGLDAARAVFERAADVARALARADLLARAALGFNPWTPYGRVRKSGLPLLEEALAAQPDTDSALKAALLTRLAYTLEGTVGAGASRERIRAFARDGVRMARRTGDGLTLGRCLFESRWVDWDPATFAARRAGTDELLAVAEGLGDCELAVIGEGWRVAEGLEVGDPLAVDRAMRRHAALASELRQPEHRWWSAVWRAMRAVMEGRYAESDDLIAHALEIGQRVEPENALLVAFVQTSQSLIDRGQLEHALTALEQVVADRAEVFEGDATVSCRRARLLAELGRTIEARRELERLAVEDFEALTPDMRYADNLAALAIVSAALGDRARAGAISERLRSAEGRNLVFGPGLVVAGPAAHYQGLLAALMDRYDVAERHFEDALRMSRRMGWIPLATRTQYEYASMLLRRGRREDRARTASLLDHAARAADAFGLERVALGVAALRGR